MVGYKRLMELARCHSITPLRGSILARFWGSDCMVLAGKCAENAANHAAWGILVFLGVVASGIGYFMWTTARRRWTPERWAL